MIADFNTSIYIISSLIVLLAIFIRTLTGLGGALLTVSLLSLFLPFKFIVGLDTLIETIVLASMVPFLYKNTNFKEINPLAIGAVVGTIFGLVFLRNVPEAMLSHILGFVIIISVVFLVIEQKRHLKMPYNIGYLFGLIGGSFGSAVGSTAPAFAVFLSGRIQDKDVLRASILSLVFFVSLLRATLFIGTGIITLTTFYWFLALSPSIVLGHLLGRHVSHLVTSVTLKRAIVGLIFVLGVGLLIV